MHTVRAEPLRTPLLTAGDDIVAVSREALVRHGREVSAEDVLVLCESPLAITQGRIARIDEMRPGLVARVLCRFFGQKGSLSTVYGMQAAIETVGLPRILVAFFIGAAGRAVGRHGDFFRVAGREVAWIDDVTGTLPPYTQDIVLGPSDPGGVANEVARAVGCEAAVVDANDLGRVEILGASPGVDAERLREVMRDNPQGNDDEQTPLVLVMGASRR